jgi:hypothetical protein
MKKRKHADNTMFHFIIGGAVMTLIVLCRIGYLLATP